ncbi:hypothetical protein D3H65_20290 [Paraflavitalea soli]|uniref:Uncharacterized protein n=1 Tax=Paraflavitalea soli TaxID=2315862 RepID=A0A3B7MS36_9BACT|nr:hypothetical protein [Paraflavitalea soli]AXY76183.1 hypothetical protein D3H65_20290 [Paraflavitalea soli]
MQNGKKAAALCAGKDFMLSEAVMEMGDNHLSTSDDTPLRPGAFDMDNVEKVKKIEGLFRQLMETLGLDLTDDSLRGTPLRLARMYVTSFYGGKFGNAAVKEEFLRYAGMATVY